MKANYILAIGVLALIFASCHSVRNTNRGNVIRQHTSGHVDTRQPGEPQQDQPKGKAGKVIKYAKGWIGTPYLYGGNDRKGVDCSGFVCRVFADTDAAQLPRDSRSQAEYSRRVDRKKLQPGDLVFFVSSQGGSRINHVALYIGDNKIIHATTSRGVIISDMNENYWASHYYCCGRVL